MKIEEKNRGKEMNLRKLLDKIKMMKKGIPNLTKG